jgi:tetratricopeptide (TPR) repeat protein
MVILFLRNRMAFFFAAFAIVTIVPVSNLIIPIGTIMAERFLYLPAVGFAACTVMGICAIGDKLKFRLAAPIAMCLIIPALGARTWVRNSDWQDNLSLMRAGVAAAPNSYANHHFLAAEMFFLDPTYSNIYEVIEEEDKSLAILDPLPDSLNFAEPYASAGTYYERKGDLRLRTSADGRMIIAPESMPDYQKALQFLKRGEAIDKLAAAESRARELARGKSESEILPSGSLSLYQELALTYLRFGDTQKAYDAALYAQSLAPSAAETHLLMATVLFEAKRPIEGVGAMVQAYLITGSPEILQSLGKVFTMGFDPQGCAIAHGPNGLYLNNSCPPVHTIICAASANLMNTYNEARQPDAAASMRNRALSEYGCTQESLRQK